MAVDLGIVVRSTRLKEMISVIHSANDSWKIIEPPGITGLIHQLNAFIKKIKS